MQRQLQSATPAAALARIRVPTRTSGDAWTVRARAGIYFAGWSSPVIRSPASGSGRA
jgi:hypothetical protein